MLRLTKGVIVATPALAVCGILAGGLVGPAPSPPQSFLAFEQAEGKYALLKGLYIEARTIRYDRADIISILGTDVPAAVFEIKATTTVQTSCNGFQAEFADSTGLYELYVALDEDCIHDRMIAEGVRLSSGLAASERSFDDSYGNAFGVIAREGEYMAFFAPPGEPFSRNRVFSFDGRLIQSRFVRRLSGAAGWGGELDRAIMFIRDNVVLRSFYGAEISEAEFLARHAHGDFLPRCATLLQSD